jgi:hypothetical protein
VVVAVREDWVADEGRGEKGGAWDLRNQTWLPSGRARITVGVDDEVYNARCFSLDALSLPSAAAGRTARGTRRVLSGKSGCLCFPRALSFMQLTPESS